ncbi:MAG TPA: diaminopimelate epimerase, partial [Chondromyces sp.]|nr:diaminopimelate epimerase [Chondromyces sp.]
EWTEGYHFTEEQRRDLSIALCDREKGMGADGILFVMPSEKADARMRIFNSDGSEASMCGNGLRCLGRYVSGLLGKKEFIVETMKADLQVAHVEDLFEGIPTYRVEISPVLFNLDALPLQLPKEKLIDEKIEELSNTISFSAVAVPNPHLIAIVDRDQFVSDEQKTIAEKVNVPNNDLFPDGVNVSFVKNIEKGKIYVRTFERGVGFTNACGTAMSASSLITCLLGFNELEQEIEVFNPGGKVHCVAHQKTDGSYSIDLIGNATNVYTAEIEVDLQNPKAFKILNQQETGEQKLYEKLETYAKEIVNQSVYE